MATLLFLSFFLLIMIGVPVAFSLGLGGLISLVLEQSMPLLIIPQRLATGTDSFILLCIPFFVLAGELMNSGGIAKRLFKFCNVLVGHIRGGLGHVNVLISMLFAGITGAAAADSSAIGSMLIPAMHEEGYDMDFSCAITASSSTIGVIIPPSIPMVLFGAITGISVTKCFLAGIIPGILVGVAQMIVCWVISVKRDYPKGKRASLREVFFATKEASLAIGMPVIVLGGILGGIFTPTEAGAVAALYSLIVALFIYRTIKIKDLKNIFIKTVEGSATVMLIVSAASLYSWFITYVNIPTKLGNFLNMLNLGDFGLLVVIMFIYLIMGCLMDLGANIIMLTPIFYPIVLTTSIDPLQFCLITIVVLAIGLVTPPVCVCTYICAKIGNLAPERVIKSSIPFLLSMLAVAFLLLFFPSLTTWLPNL